MIIRRLEPAEQVQYSGICSTVFLDMPRRDIRAQLKDPLAHVFEGDNDRWGAFDAAGKLHSALIVIPYTLRMNGHDVKMAGIGGVVTRPESRGLGLVRKIFDQAFPVMLEKGQTFSYLFPFNYNYYRNFGYEICDTYSNISVPVEQMRGYAYPKDITPYEPGDDITPYAEIYEAFTRDRNLAVVRSADTWKSMLDRDPYKNLDFTYLNRDANGQADAYVLYQAQHVSAGDNRIKVKELCWRTTEGLHSIFGFFAKLSAELAVVDWNAPCDINAQALFPDAYDIGWRKSSGGMNRILDVAAGLSTLRAPVGIANGKVTLDIVDNYWTDNSGQYTVAWEDGSLTVAKAGGGDAAMATSAQTLAQLVTGYLSVEAAALKKDTTVNGDFLQLSRLFPKQKLHLTERF
jgi:predicted acetyltransferase